jgi:filamentous hemagglutinin
MMASAVLTSMASSGAVSLINNKGNLGATLKDALSTSSLKNDVLAGLTAGIGYELPYNPAVFSVDNLEKAAVTSVANAVAKTAVEGGSLQGNLVSSLAGAAINVGGATVANDIGGTYLPDGSLTKIGMHALLGGVLSVAQGGDFKTGALAAGADEAVVKSLSDLVMPDPATANSVTLQQAQQRLVALSGLVGILAATATGGNTSIGASVAENATQNNFLGPNSIARREADRQALEHGTATVQQAAEYKELQQRDQQSDYLRSKFAAGDSLTDAERSFLVDSYQQYYDEMVSKVGGGLADAALSGLKQNGAITTYDFPFAGTPQQKAEWTDANSQTPLDFLKTAFRSRSEDETLYNGIGHSEQIAKAQEQDVQIGQIAMLPEEGLAGIAAIGAVTIGKAVSAGSEAGGALPSTLGLAYGENNVVEVGVDRGLGSTSGHEFAGSVTEGGSGQALAGHGVMDGSSASTQYVSPAGTFVISPRPGITIADSTGQILEQLTSVEQLENTMRTGISPNGQVLTQRNYNDLAGYQVTAPGETGYNYTLLSPGFQNKPLNIFGNSTTTSAPTKLSDFLESNMGCVFWAACTQAVPYIPKK